MIARPPTTTMMIRRIVPKPIDCPPARPLAGIDPAPGRQARFAAPSLACLRGARIRYRRIAGGTSKQVLGAGMTINGVLAGKRGLVFGVANSRSIAYGIAKQARAHGAELALTYQGDALKRRVEPLAAELGAHVAGHCDVTDAASVDAVFADIGKHWESL